MLRRTKIVSTLGPATDEPGILEKLIVAGVNVVRLNFSHGEPEDHQKRADDVRAFAAKHGKYVAILGDLQGPKIRISKFIDGPIDLALGDKFVLDADLPTVSGTQAQIGIDYKDLPKDVNPDDLLLLDDGRVVFKVDTIEGNRINCTVTVAGRLSNNKGINRQGGGLTAPALTDKDIADIKTAVAIDVDYLAVSFPRNAEDMHLARKLVKEAGGDIKLVSKIERAEAVASAEVLDAIIEASDAVMVARGDLGVEIGDASLIGVQKLIISRARALNRCVITATQMMESMISSSLPTRAEVFDVANAVLDGTDAVMLSGETAAGQFPVETVEAMVRVILGAEATGESHKVIDRKLVGRVAIDQAIAEAAMHTANHMPGVTAIACLTETGSTPLLMSRYGASFPIFAMSRSEKTLRRSALCRGVEPSLLEFNSMSFDESNQKAMDELIARGCVKDGDLVIISKGDVANVRGATNTMKILEVGQPIVSINS